MNIFTIIALIAWAWLGIVSSYFLFTKNQNKKAWKIVDDAELQAKSILDRAESTAETLRKEIEDSRADIRDRKNDAIEQEKRIAEKEQKIDQKYEELEWKRTELRNKEATLEQKISEIDKKSQNIESKLEEIARLSQSDAKELLMKYTEERYEKDIVSLIEKKKKETMYILWVISVFERIKCEKY